ncbi:MAG TPA: class F sortase [Dehalococcoidia bacterium]|jgi:hypothetical protein
MKKQAFTPSSVTWLPLRGLFLASTLALAMAVAACGGGGGGSKSGTSSDASASPTLEAAAAPTEAAATATPEAAAPTAGDHVVIAKIGVDAPISVQKVGADGQMPNPNGPDDIAWYDFDQSLWPGLGGRPGSGGNVVIAGHVDWGVQHSGLGCKNNTVKPPCEAVLWDLSKLSSGDIIEVDVGDKVYKYQINGSKSYAATFTGWNDLLSGHGQESLTIVTCSGDFNPATHEYNSRLVVTALRVA